MRNVYIYALYVYCLKNIANILPVSLKTFLHICLLISVLFLLVNYFYFVLEPPLQCETEVMKADFLAPSSKNNVFSISPLIMGILQVFLQVLLPVELSSYFLV